MIVLDTNVVSEIAHPLGNPAVMRWFDYLVRRDLFLTAITTAELGYGIACLPEGRRRDELSRRLRVLVDEKFAERVLAFDVDAARRYGPVVAGRQGLGRRIGILDAQIAAICLHHGAALATRNTRDFEDLGLTLINPWEEA